MARSLPPSRAFVFTPDELRRTDRTGQALVGGRVLSARGRRLVVADALASLDVTLAEGELVAPGDIVVLSGDLAAGGLHQARLVDRTPGALPEPGTEFARLATEGVGARLVARAAILRALRAELDGAGFIEVETPLRVPSPGLDAHVDAFQAEGGWLITSPELHLKRLVVGGLPRVYQLARVSRKEELGALHEPEFTLLEWYRAFSDMDAVVQDTESLVTAAAEALHGKTRLKLRGRTIELRSPWERVTVRDAFREHAGVADAADLAASDEDRYFQLLVDEVEPALAARPRPVALTAFPATQAALARRRVDDPAVAERFEVYVAGVELCNGFSELTDPVEQRARFEAELARRRRVGAPEHPIDERFLQALAEGMPPAAGNALGVDRLVMLLTAAERLEQVVAFPAARGA
ncbi:MAG: EF-P lysine aminoacylase GenX [Deltaproteobacteria bacterium]|nr:EF-P lysine aminoacylase GenX [Deltaproteobacteria bacterium]